jgi:hypothetical protein
MLSPRGCFNFVNIGLTHWRETFCRKGTLRSYYRSPKYYILAEGIFVVDLNFDLLGYQRIMCLFGAEYVS